MTEGGDATRIPRSTTPLSTSSEPAPSPASPLQDQDRPVGSSAASGRPGPPAAAQPLTDREALEKAGFDLTYTTLSGHMHELKPGDLIVRRRPPDPAKGESECVAMYRACMGEWDPADDDGHALAKFKAALAREIEQAERRGYETARLLNKALTKPASPEGPHLGYIDQSGGTR